MTDDSRQSARQAWAERLNRFGQTSQTIAEFCAAESVSPASFYQWRRKLRPTAIATQTTARFVPVQLPTPRQAEPVTVMAVELPGGVRVRLEVTGTTTEQP